MMFGFLTIKYLAITWSDQDTVLKIEESHESLEVEYQEDGTVKVETVTYNDVYHQLGFCFAEEPLHTPYFQRADGSREELIAFKSPSTNKIWWIQNSGWNSQYRRYYSELWRTVGNFDLVIQKRHLILENNNLEFTVKELEYYLRDFKNDLWMLILDNDNSAKAKVDKEVPNFLTDEVCHFYRDFIDSAEKLIKNPNMFLAERQSMLPIKKVKPIAKTFRELIENPNRKQATSRDFYESYDTAENRYIHYCVDRILYLLRCFDRLVNAQLTSYQSKIDQEKVWIDELQNKEVKKIDKNVFQEEINTIQEQIENTKNQIQQTRQDLKQLKRDLDPYKVYDELMNSNYYKQKCNELKYEKFQVILGQKSEQENSYFVQQINGVNRDNFIATFGVSAIIFSIYDKSFENIDLSNIKTILMFDGFYFLTKSTSTKNNVYNKLYFHKITKLDFNEDKCQEILKLQYQIDNREKLIKQRNITKDKLEQADWKQDLNQSEKKENKKEAEMLLGKVKLFENMSNQMKVMSEKFPSFISHLQVISKFFKQYEVKKSSNCPNSMVFIQNPLYASCKSLFKKLIDLNGLDIRLFDTMMQIDEIGLVNISNLYEKWCLIQVIKILKDTYKFTLQDDWQTDLIQSILRKEYNIAINMELEKNYQSIVLTYEKVLNNNKRPDIVIDLTTQQVVYQKNPHDRQYYPQFNGSETKRLVLDAKFKNFKNQYIYDQLINELYITKNYSENGNNQVFIIHPTPNVIQRPTSSLEWGRFCDYGQSNDAVHRYNERQKTNCDPIHRCGGVFLSPSLKYPHTSNNLQRLLGMFLQQNSQRLTNPINNEYCYHNMSCMSCGNYDKSKLLFKPSKTKGGNDKYDLICQICKHHTNQTICYHCKHPIFKNGLKWTYHRTKAEDVFNVICPRCENFL